MIKESNEVYENNKSCPLDIRMCYRKRYGIASSTNRIMTIRTSHNKDQKLTEVFFFFDDKKDFIANKKEERLAQQANIHPKGDERSPKESRVEPQKRKKHKKTLIPQSVEAYDVIPIPC